MVVADGSVDSNPASYTTHRGAPCPYFSAPTTTVRPVAPCANPSTSPVTRSSTSSREERGR